MVIMITLVTGWPGLHYHHTATRRGARCCSWNGCILLRVAKRHEGAGPLRACDAPAALACACGLRGAGESIYINRGRQFF